MCKSLRKSLALLGRGVLELLVSPEDVVHEQLERVVGEVHRIGGLHAVPLPEALAGLLTQVALTNHGEQSHRRVVARVLGSHVHRQGDAQHGIQADQVPELEGALLVAQAHVQAGVAVLNGDLAAFQSAQRFQHLGDQHLVHPEPGDVGYDERGLAQLDAQQFHDHLQHIVVDSGSLDHFHTRHDVGRIHEVGTHHPPVETGRLGHLQYVEAAGVGQEDRVFAHDLAQLHQELLLDGHVFEDHFQHQLDLVGMVTQLIQALEHRETLDRLGGEAVGVHPLTLAVLALLLDPAQVGQHAITSRRSHRGVAIEHEDVEAAFQPLGDDVTAHLAGTTDQDSGYVG